MNITSSSIIMKRKVEWSFLVYEMPILVEAQKLYELITGHILQIGARRNIKLLIDGEFYDASFRNEGFNRNTFGDRTNLVYLTYGTTVKKKLQEIFAETYGKMAKIKETLPPRARMPKVDCDDYIVLSASSNPDVFCLDCVTGTNIAKAKEQLFVIPEEEYENMVDETAGFNYSSSVRKIRHLDRSIGDSLKKLYDFRCQMTGEKVGELYDTCVVEAHHIVPFTESMNNDTSNIIILSPNYHRIIHRAKPTFDRKNLAFVYQNGLVDKIKLNKHLY